MLKKMTLKSKKAKKDHVEVDEFKNAKKGWRKQVQRFGSFMAGMVMPVVSILIAWGLLAALFLTEYNSTGDYVSSKGWVKNEWVGNSLGRIIGPTMKYLIPILIAFIAGRMIYDIRGGMIGAFVITLAIIGNDWLYRSDVMGNILTLNGQDVVGQAPNQIVGALVLGPISAWIFKKIESLYIDHIKAGFEMIVKNFGLALVAMILGVASFFGWGFIMYGISYVMVAILSLFTKNPWSFPFVAIFTEPLRAMFLNNAVNHGVMVPLGMQDLAINHKVASWYFMVGANPGPGFGLLMAYVAWRKQQRAAAAGASVIQLVGGIHEVHYVYILAEPIMILSTIFGAMSGLAVIAIFDGGTSAVVSPGSIISVIAMSPGTHYIWVNVLAVVVSAVVAFLVASVIMIFKKKSKSTTMSVNVTDSGITFDDSNSKKSAKQNLENVKNFDWKNAKLLFVACDAGMGSSAMAAGIIKKYAKDHKIDITIKNGAVKEIDETPDIIVTLNVFGQMARDRNKHAYIYTLEKFLGDGVYDELFKQMDENLAHLK